MSNDSDSDSDSGNYKPNVEFHEDHKEALIDINMTQSTELWLLKLPASNDLLTDIDGQELSLKLNNEGNLASFEGASGKVFDFISFASHEPDEMVFVSSATEPKIAGKISRRVSIVHYPTPEELEKANSINKQALRNSEGATMTTSRYFPVQSNPRSSRASNSKGSRGKSSLSEFSGPLETPKRRPDENKSDGRPVRDSSHGHSSGVSAMSSDHSHGEKVKRRKHKE